MAVFQFWLNRPHVADLLIETEAELKKVTWPTMPDTASSSLIVLITVLVIFLLVAVYDFGLSQLIDKLLY
ncbi:MAG: preprotein translocase subunit SecE [Planctomycetes bacterium]|nr:preprotein translocase subunit SecE [Planctomycetota bacterium]